jgi:hypothetical protein
MFAGAAAPVIPDPTTLPGFTDMLRQPDYVQTSQGFWVPRSTTIVGGEFRNGGATPPADTNGEPHFVGPDGHFDVLASGSGTSTWDQFFSGPVGYTCVVGFVSTQAVAFDNISYDSPAVITEGGGYWGISYTNRVECWHYPGAYQPGVVLPLAINTPTIVSMRYDPGHPLNQRLQARRMKDPWTNFVGAGPGPPGSTTGVLLMGQNYAEARNLVGSVRFLLTYNQPLLDADVDKCVDWATGTWPGYFS